MVGKASLALASIEMHYGKVRALHGVDLTIEPGEIVALTGPSGAGKTTTCRVISGIDWPSAGQISLGGRAIGHLAPQQRGVAYMFESYALYPRLSVFDNVAFPLRSPANSGRYDQTAIGERVREALELAEIGHLDRRLPSQLSGGQKQRVALCRLLVQEPAAFLLDEPISHLDAKLRHKLRAAIRRRLTGFGTPTLWCTPDGLEALSVGDRVAVLIDGIVEQVGRPQDVYDAPANTKVARLIGDPAMNLMQGRIQGNNGALVFANGVVSVPLPGSLGRACERLAGEGDVVLGFRATEVDIAAAGAAAGAPGEIYTFEPFGKYNLISARLGDHIVKAKTTRPDRFETKQPITVGVNNTRLVLFDAVTGKSIEPAR
jgi:ABC-type sugar transport system ATPase subunit